MFICPCKYVSSGSDHFENRKKIDSNHIIMTKEKLEFFGIVKEALKLPIKNPNFILVFLITSFPLFFFLLSQEIIFQQSLLQAHKLFFHDPQHRHPIDILVENFSASRLLTSLLLLGIIHVLDLVNTIITVYTASVMCKEEAKPMNLKQMLCTPINKVGFKGPLITSICVLILSSLTLFWAWGCQICIAWYMTLDEQPFLRLIFGVLFMALLPKHIEWSAVWNISVVMSILEEKHGDVAIIICAYLSKGNGKRGFLLAFVFFAWKVASRVLCLYYVGWHKTGTANLVQVIAGKVCLDCVGNFMMWVVFVVYFYDCRMRSLEKRLMEQKEEQKEEYVALTAQVV